MTPVGANTSKPNKVITCTSMRLPHAELNERMAKDLARKDAEAT
jgi:hypothetical protein